MRHIEATVENDCIRTCWSCGDVAPLPKSCQFSSVLSPSSISFDIIDDWSVKERISHAVLELFFASINVPAGPVVLVNTQLKRNERTFNFSVFSHNLNQLGCVSCRQWYWPFGFNFEYALLFFQYKFFIFNELHFIIVIVYTYRCSWLMRRASVSRWHGLSVGRSRCCVRPKRSELADS